MESNKNTEIESSIYKRRKIPSLCFQKIRSLVKSFEEEEVSNKRFAIAGLLILLMVFPAFFLYEKVSNKFISPDYVIVATLVELFEVQRKYDENREEYIVNIKIENGEIVLASVNENEYSRLKMGDKVKVGYFKGGIFVKYEIIGKEN